MIRRILHYGEDTLRQESEPITQIDDELRELVNDMFETMAQAHGLGLAAPQVGVNKRLFIIELDNQKWVFINPEIVKTTGKDTCEEGCLSVPGLRETVQRAARVVCQATDLDGSEYEVEAEGLMARAIQHENDHLDGVLFVDRISKARRVQLKRDLELIAEGKVPTVPEDDEDEDSDEVESEATSA